MALVVIGLTKNIWRNVPANTNQEQIGAGKDNGALAKSPLEGILQNSDDTSRGNFKLVSDQGDIYIRTNRDFQKLVGLEVLVLINGTLDNFEMVDIQPKIEKDGYILSQ